MNKNRKPAAFIGIGLAIGAGAGVAIGNIAVGVGVGLAIGAALAAATRNKVESQPGTPEEIWRAKSDEEVSAAMAAIDEYTEVGQRVIREEAARRGITEQQRRRDRREPELGKCYKCLRQLSMPRQGVYKDLSAVMSASPYPCRSCATEFCAECMRQLRKGSCPYCGDAIGW